MISHKRTKQPKKEFIVVFAGVLTIHAKDEEEFNEIMRQSIYDEDQIDLEEMGRFDPEKCNAHLHFTITEK